MNISIRPARQEDQQTIVSFVRQAQINPRNLNWENFLVAEDENFGFRQLDVSRLPPEFRRDYWIGRIITSLASVFQKDKVRIIPMKKV